MAFLIVPSVAAAALCSVVMKRVGLRGARDLFVFNLISSVVWLVILGGLYGLNGGGAFSAREILWGIAYGAVQSLFLVFKAGAMSSGPVSVTTLIGNCSLILSTAVSVLFLREKIALPTIPGIALLLIAIALCTLQKPDGTKATKRWIFYCVGFFTFAAGVGITFKLFSGSGSDDCGRMMLVAAAVMCAVTLGLSAATGAFRKQSFLRAKSAWLPVLLCGVLSCGYNRLNIVLAGALPGAFFYPVFNGGVILLSALLSLLLLRERLMPRQWAGIVLGTAAIAVIGIF